MRDPGISGSEVGVRGTKYLGGLVRRSQASGPQRGALTAALAHDGTWRRAGTGCEVFVRSEGCQAILGTSSAVLLRGHAVPRGASSPTDARRIAQEVADHYLEHGELPVDRYEGSFTLAMLDGRARRVLLYRNPVGSSFTYYTLVNGSLLFGSNLAELVAAAHVTPRPNHEVLPAYFLYRFVPGRETLFAGIYRLLPGEQVSFADSGLTREQRCTLADLGRPNTVGADAVDRIEDTMAQVMADGASRWPRAANLLSGGVDSSYIQARWNQTAEREEKTPVSFSVSVDHPRTRADTEYALTAARALGVRHTLVPANRPYASYLIETIAATGEPPNHVMAAYFGHLAREMGRRGRPIGLCGEGADSLFGTGWTDILQRARRMRKVVPSALLRQWLGGLAARLGRRHAHDALELAARVDDIEHALHPINQIGAFTDLPAVRACFGIRAVVRATAYRRALLVRQGVPADPLEQVHACGFLGEAVDSAALWTTLFNRWGGDLFCPFLDSRVIGLALSVERRFRFPPGRPKDLLKRALCRHMPRALVYRNKLGFGQPIFEWLAPGGQLRPWVETIGTHEFVDRAALASALVRPNWFLYSLLCYDIWHKLFIQRSIPIPFENTERTAEETAAALAIP